MYFLQDLSLSVKIWQLIRNNTNDQHLLHRDHGFCAIIGD